MQIGEACFVKETGLQELHRAVKIAMRRGHTTGQQKRLFHTGFALIHGDPVFQRGFVFDDARREMRHDIIAFARDARGGFHHVFNRRAFDMGDIDTGALGQQIAEILDLFCGARHDLDGIAIQKGLNLRSHNGAGLGFLFKVQKRHDGLPKLIAPHAGHSHPSFAIRALIFS